MNREEWLEDFEYEEFQKDCYREKFRQESGDDDIEHHIDDYYEYKKREDLEGFDSEEQRDEWYNGG